MLLEVLSIPMLYPPCTQTHPPHTLASVSHVYIHLYLTVQQELRGGGVSCNWFIAETPLPNSWGMKEWWFGTISIDVPRKLSQSNCKGEVNYHGLQICQNPHCYITYPLYQTPKQSPTPYILNIVCNRKYSISHMLPFVSAACVCLQPASGFK